MYDQEEYDSDTEDNQESEEKYNKSYIVIAIDCHESMFIKNEDGTLPFRNCLEACCRLADSLLLSGSGGAFAVVLAKQEIDFIRFEDNVIDKTNLLWDKLKMSDEDLEKEFLRKYELEYSNFFLKCKKTFHDITKPFLKRILLFLTNDANPSIDKMKRFQAINEVKTFTGSQIEFQIIPSNEEFNYKLFYYELFDAMGTEIVEEICKDADGLLQKLSSFVNPSIRKQNIQFYPFQDNDSHSINCIQFNPVGDPHLLNQKVTRDGKIVKPESATDMDEPIYNIKCSIATRVDSMAITASERDELFDYTRKLGLHLLYVSKRITQLGAVMSTPKLLQVDPKKPSQYFEKFWRCCINSGRVLVCISKIRQPDKVRFVELIPLLVNATPTFLIQQIPYTTQIIYPQKADYPQPQNKREHKALVEELVEKLSLPFNVEMIPDVCYRKKKAYVKAKLMNQKKLDEVEDLTFDATALDDVLRDVVKKMRDAFVIEDKKRKVPISRAAGASKKKK